MPVAQAVLQKSFAHRFRVPVSPVEYEPNEETVAALIEAEDLDRLETCADLHDMLKKCGVRC